jgi:hypothetical protein
MLNRSLYGTNDILPSLRQIVAVALPLESSFPGQNLSDGVSDRDTSLLNLFPGEANS